MKKIKAIAIDGPAGSGKSTVARMLAEKLGYRYIDTGAMYRALTLKVMREGIRFSDEKSIISLTRKTKIELLPAEGETRRMPILLDGDDVTEEIRTMAVTGNVKYVCRIPSVREELVRRQRTMAAGSEGAVMEGRDIGTVVLKNAVNKFYIDASFERRVDRRYNEILSKGGNVSREDVAEDLEKRDSSDTNRSVGPLKKAHDAMLIDTTDMTPETVVDLISQVSSRVEKVNLAYRFSRALLELFVRMLFPFQVSGHENFPIPPFIVAANHTSLIDPPIVGAACKRYSVNFVVKQELFEIPIVRHWSRKVDCIPVQRGKNSIRGLREAVRRLHDGKIVGIFPEGTRSGDGSLREAKTGTGFLISMAKVPVVPIYVFGTDKAFPKGKPPRPGTRVGAVIGKPILFEEKDLSGLKGRELYEKISTDTMSAISALRDVCGL